MEAVPARLWTAAMRKISIFLAISTFSGCGVILYSDESSDLNKENLVLNLSPLFATSTLDTGAITLGSYPQQWKRYGHWRSQPV